LVKIRLSRETSQSGRLLASAITAFLLSLVEVSTSNQPASQPAAKIPVFALTGFLRLSGGGTALLRVGKSAFSSLSFLGRHIVASFVSICETYPARPPDSGDYTPWLRPTGRLGELTAGFTTHFLAPPRPRQRKTMASCSLLTPFSIRQGDRCVLYESFNTRKSHSILQTRRRVREKKVLDFFHSISFTQGEQQKSYDYSTDESQYCCATSGGVYVHVIHFLIVIHGILWSRSPVLLNVAFFSCVLVASGASPLISPLH
jgi:hypothetical protein